MNRERIEPGGAIKFGDLVFTSGMVGRDPVTRKLAGEDIESQARQTMKNLQAALEAAGTSLENSLKVTAFLADLGDRPAFNEVYAEFIAVDPPARTCIQGGFLGEGILVEIDVIAAILG